MNTKSTIQNIYVKFVLYINNKHPRISVVQNHYLIKIINYLLINRHWAHIIKLQAYTKCLMVPKLVFCSTIISFSRSHLGYNIPPS